MINVIMPEWWTDGKRVIGHTDGIATYCCSLTPAYFVNVPEYDYSGYFQVSDLTEVV